MRRSMFIGFALALACGAAATVHAGADSPQFRGPVLTSSTPDTSESTRKTDVSVVLLTPIDLARLGDESIVRKARVAARRAELETLAGEGNAYAQWLLGLRPGGQDDMPLIEKAANQGLIRAMALRAAVLAQKGGADRDVHLRELEKLGTYWHSGYAFYLYFTLTQDDPKRPAGPALARAAEFGFAPAQVQVARLLSLQKGHEAWQQGRAWAESAAQAGDEEAKALLASYPPKPAS
jgi:hypothetical protein